MALWKIAQAIRRPPFQVWIVYRSLGVCEREGHDRKVPELAIFLTAHITEDPYIAEADERIYNTYTEDPVAAEVLVSKSLKYF